MPRILQGIRYPGGTYRFRLKRTYRFHQLIATAKLLYRDLTKINLITMLRQYQVPISFRPVDTGAPVYTQITRHFESEIANGHLKPGTALPGSRELARKFSLNRQTVIRALEELISKGWLYTVPNKGTFVSQPEHWPGSRKPRTGVAEPAFSFNQFATSLGLLKDAMVKCPVRFDDGFADLQLSPVKELMTAYRSQYEQTSRIKKIEGFSLDGPEQLLQQLNRMLRLHRGLKINQQNCTFIRGNQMTFFLVAYTLLCRGDEVAVENPGNLFAWDIFRQAGANVVPVKVDDHGIDTEHLEQICRQRKITAVYVTPQCQYPTTVILSPERRKHLVALAEAYSFVIIESDFEHEFWFSSMPVLPMAADYPEHVVYIGSLSRMLNPLMRIGFVSAPTKFIQSLQSLTASVDSCGDYVLEKTVATLMAEGVINKYIRKSALSYRTKKAQMANLLRQHLGARVQFDEPSGGLAYWIKFTEQIDIQLLVKGLLKAGVSVPPLPLYHMNLSGPIPAALRIGFGSVSNAEMETGIRAIKRTLADCRTTS